jgi:hypothetical protein
VDVLAATRVQAESQVAAESKVAADALPAAKPQPLAAADTEQGQAEEDDDMPPLDEPFTPSPPFVSAAGGGAALGLSGAALPALPARQPNKGRKVAEQQQQRFSTRRAVMHSLVGQMQQAPPVGACSTTRVFPADVEAGPAPPGHAESAALLERVRGSRFAALAGCVAAAARGYVWGRTQCAALERPSVHELRSARAAATTHATLARDPLLAQLVAAAGLGPNQLAADPELCAAICQLHDKPGHLLDLLLHAYWAAHSGQTEDRTALLAMLATADAMSVRVLSQLSQLSCPLRAH